jgi:diguanylate cyclase (GGDEF)-like protein
MEETEPYLEAVRKTVENYQMVVRNLDHRPDSMEKGLERRGRRKQNRENNVVSVTISIGVAQRNETKQTPEETLKNADTALYTAKQNGRNCVILHKA